jgi:hypothetical protein
MPTAAEQLIDDVESIKEKLVSLIQPLVPKALVYPRFIYDENTEHWEGLLTSENDLDDKDVPRVHCVQVYYDGLGDNLDVPLRTASPVIPFGIGFFHYYNKGTDAVNPEREFMAEILTVCWTMNVKTDLDMRSLVRGHSKIKIPRFNFWPKLGRTPILTANAPFEVTLMPRFLSL